MFAKPSIGLEGSVHSYSLTNVRKQKLSIFVSYLIAASLYRYGNCLSYKLYRECHMLLLLSVHNNDSSLYICRVVHIITHSIYKRRHDWKQHAHRYTVYGIRKMASVWKIVREKDSCKGIQHAINLLLKYHLQRIPYLLCPLWIDMSTAEWA